MAMDSATLYKLMILYMLNKVDFPLTNSQISEFFLENEYTNYFSLQESINELCENNFVFSDTVRNTSYYHLTSEGRESLKFFENKIPNAIIKIASKIAPAIINAFDAFSIINSSLFILSDIFLCFYFIFLIRLL